MVQRGAWAAVAMVAAAFGVGCGPARAAGEANGTVLLKAVPHVRQKPDFCGEACAEMWLRKLGHDVDQDAVFDQSGLDPLLGRGCYTKELNAALTRIGFKTGSVFASIRAAAADEDLDTQWQLLYADLLKGIPSIVCMRYADRPETTEHFRLVLGYDGRTDEVVYHEPAEADGGDRRMKKALFLKLWPLKYDAKQWTIVRLRLESGKVTPPPPAAGFTGADYAQHIRSLKAKVPAGFTIVIEKPFVVIGDEPGAILRRRAEGTVRWAVERLKAEYFDKDPDRILDIWLFKDNDSYRKHTKGIFNDNPSTPYGYYSSQAGALIMNIATGGGTLVHEIVHPFVASNFAACPSWFNEGLGSLYEQSGERNGRIVGNTNWRLAGLQKAIRAGKLPAFETLCSTTTRQFYYSDSGTNYAQARYLLYYLQEKGLLQRYYKAFFADQKNDPTGYKTLQKTLGEADMAAFQKRWEAWVLTLRFP